MIAVILTDSGRFNVIGTADNTFTLQGNLNLEELKELQAAIKEAIKESKR